MRVGIRIQGVDGIPDAVVGTSGHALLWPIYLLQLPDPGPDAALSGSRGPELVAGDPLPLGALRGEKSAAGGFRSPPAPLTRPFPAGANPAELQVAVAALVTPASVPEALGRRVRDDLVASLQLRLGRGRQPSEDPMASFFMLLSGDAEGARLAARAAGSGAGDEDEPGKEAGGLRSQLGDWAGTALHMKLPAAVDPDTRDLLAGRAEFLRRVAPEDGRGGVEVLSSVMGFGGGAGSGTPGSLPDPHEADLEKASALSLSGLGLLPASAFREGKAAAIRVMLRGEAGARGTGTLVASVRIQPGYADRPALVFEAPDPDLTPAKGDEGNRPTARRLTAPLLVAAGKEAGGGLWFELGDARGLAPRPLDPAGGKVHGGPPLLLQPDPGRPVVGGWRAGPELRVVRFAGQARDRGHEVESVTLPDHPRLQGPVALAAGGDGRLGVAGVDADGRIVLLVEERPATPDRPVIPPVVPPVVPPVRPPVGPPVGPQPGRPPVTPPVTPPVPPQPGRPPVGPQPGGPPTPGGRPGGGPGGRPGGGLTGGVLGGILGGSAAASGRLGQVLGGLEGRSLGRELLDRQLQDRGVLDRLAEAAGRGGAGAGVRGGSKAAPGSGPWKVVSPALTAPPVPPETLALVLLAGEKEDHPWVFHAGPADPSHRSDATAPTDGARAPAALSLDRRVGGRWSRSVVALDRLGPLDVAGGVAVNALHIRSEKEPQGAGTVLLLAAVDREGKLTLVTSQVAAAGDAPGNPELRPTWRSVPLDLLEGEIPAGLGAPSMAVTPDGTGAAVAFRGPGGEILLLTTGTAAPLPGDGSAPSAIHLEVVAGVGRGGRGGGGRSGGEGGGDDERGDPVVALAPRPPDVQEVRRVVHPSRALPAVSWTDAGGVLHLARRGDSGPWTHRAVQPGEEGS